MRPENVVYAGFSLFAWTNVFLRDSELGAWAFCYLITLALGVFLIHHGNPNKETMLFQTMFNGILGPLGAISGAVLVTAKLLRRKHDSARLEAWYRELSGRSQKAPVRDIAREIETGRLRPESKITPKSAQEILVNGTQKEKREILTWIARRRDPMLRPLLEIAVQGGDPTIRSQAASILFRQRGGASP